MPPPDRDRRRSTAATPAMLYDAKQRLTREDLWAFNEALDRLDPDLGHPRRRPPPPTDELVAALSEPDFYPHAVDGVELRETHISWIFLAGARAYKLKKPLILPFLDYGTRERRRQMCELEVALNRRLAPDVYLGVQAIVRRGDGFALASAGAEGAVEHVVAMRRFDEGSTLAGRVGEDRAGVGDVEAVGSALAAFHARAEPAAHPERATAEAARTADETIQTLIGCEGAVKRERLIAARRFVDAFLAAHSAELAQRAAEGRVRACHGDVRAEHVLLEQGRVQVVDCIEFDAALREIDVGADLAFLLMDLHRLGRADLAGALVTAYREAGGDPGPDPLLAFHAATRAWVRAKVCALAPQGATAARELFTLGERLAWSARLPLAIVICGPPACGKTCLAEALSDSSGLTRFGSDETRKRLASIAPTQRAPSTAYADGASLRTYSELGSLAAAELDRAGGVIVDASFRRSVDRRAFASAFGSAGKVVFFECRAPVAVIDARARRREADPNRVSDAGPPLAARLGEQFEPLEEVEANLHFALRTDRAIDETLADVIAAIDIRLAPLATPGP